MIQSSGDGCLFYGHGVAWHGMAWGSIYLDGTSDRQETPNGGQLPGESFFIDARGWREGGREIKSHGLSLPRVTAKKQAKS